MAVGLGPRAGDEADLKLMELRGMCESFIPALFACCVDCGLALRYIATRIRTQSGQR